VNEGLVNMNMRIGPSVMGRVLDEKRHRFRTQTLRRP
jgi:hypothetical protein